MADYSKRFTIPYTVFKVAEVQRNSLEEAKDAIIAYEHRTPPTSGYKHTLRIVFGNCTEFANHPIQQEGGDPDDPQTNQGT